MLCLYSLYYLVLLLTKSLKNLDESLIRSRLIKMVVCNY